MSKPYSVLLKEIQVLQAHAEEVKNREIVGVIAKIKDAMKTYSITIAELCEDKSSDRTRARAGRSGARPVKYSDAQGNVWGGRGPRPMWLRKALAEGKTLGDFEVGDVRS